MVAGAAGVAWVGPDGGALLRTKQRLHGGVDVEEDLAEQATAERPQALRGHQALERGDRRFVEASEVAVDRVQTGHDAAGEADEERIGGERLKPEDTRFARGEGVHQQPQLGGHGVDDGGSVLEGVEGVVQDVVDPLFGKESTEGGEAGDAGERQVGGANAEAARVGALNGLCASMAVAALASEHVAAHLLGARRREGCGHSKRQHDLRRAFVQAASSPQGQRSADRNRRKGAKRTFSRDAERR